MNLSDVHDHISGESRADTVIRLIAVAERVAADGPATSARRTARRRAWMTSGAAAVLLAGGIGTAVATRDNDEDEVPVPVPPIRSSVGPTTTPAPPTTPVPPASTAIANAPVGTGPATTIPATTIPATTIPATTVPAAPATTVPAPSTSSGTIPAAAMIGPAVSST
jgi:hypothetical protein